ncbi:MAG: rod shape-determining protein MreC [Bacteroidales bacterium]
MQNLINFLLKHSSWFLFLLYLIISLTFLFKSNAYQRSYYFNTSNQIVGTTLALSGNFTSYFDLGHVNEALSFENAVLEKKVLELEDQLKAYKSALMDTTFADTLLRVKYDFIPAQVVNNSVNQLQNYITINRGSEDGIRKDMGVVDHNGIVGIVSAVSNHYSVVISLLNTKLRLSGKIKNSEFFGSLTWDGLTGEQVLLEELPRHVIYKEGDTIVTSGFSTVFPEGIMVGRIATGEKQSNDNFYRLKINLSTDFYRLRDVRVIKNNFDLERRKLEETADTK